MSSVTGTTSTNVAPIVGAVQSAEAAFAQALSAARGNAVQGSAPRTGETPQELEQEAREFEMELVLLRNELASLELAAASDQGSDPTRPGTGIGGTSTDPEGDPAIQQGSLTAEVGRPEGMAAPRGSNNQANNIEARIMEVQTRLAELKALLSAIRSA